MLGDNFVRLEGYIKKKFYKEYDSGSKLFKCSLAIPSPNSSSDYQYINISTWGEKAEALATLSENTAIRIYGHIEKRSYSANCRYCNASQTNYWMEVAIDNFKILEEKL